MPTTRAPLEPRLYPLSPDLHRFLFEIATGDLRTSLTEANLDWAEAIQELQRHGLVGLAYRRFQSQPRSDFPPLAFQQEVKNAFLGAVIHSQLLVRRAMRIFRKLAEAGVDFMLVKGAAVGHTVYPKPSLRVFGDIDIVVHERDWSAIHQVLVSNGFESQEGWPTPVPKYFPLNIVQELKYWNPAEQLLIEVHFEDLLYAGLAARDVDGFWQRSRFVELDGLRVRVLGAEDQLIHLCAHLHYDGIKRLNWFSDIAFIIRDHAGELDWQKVIGIVRREDAPVPVYYALSYVGHALGVWPPERVLTALRPDLFRRWWHERYIPQERVLSLENVPVPLFSYYFQPLFRRLIPDLLVMGRRAEKTRALLLLLVPPPTWLRYYYGLPSTDDVTGHYLLHPLKLTYHYLREIKTALGNLYREWRREQDWPWWCFDRPK